MHTTLISTTDLAAHLADPSFVIVDVRHDLSQPESWGRTEYERAHLPGARFVHLDRDLSGPKTGSNGRHPLPDPDALAELFGRIGIDASKQVVAYDQGPGSYAARLWWMLRWLGHDGCAVLDGGFTAWQREGLPVTAEAPATKAASFGHRRSGSVIDVRTVAESLGKHSLFLLDARGRERFRGDAEPLDRVPGHIPGAVNRPYTENLGPDSKFKPVETLRAELRSIIGERPAGSIVSYCGSGVTACHNLLAMEHAGLGRAGLYPGSWSEWCADPARPVARGDA